MAWKTGECAECGGEVLAVDPESDRVLYAIFGASMAEHRPGCSRYPDTVPVDPAEL